MSYEWNAQDIQEILAEEGQQPLAPQVDQPDPSFLQKAADFAQRNINEPIQQSGIPAAAAHLMAAPFHAAANIADLPGNLSNVLFGTNIPRIQVPASVDPITYSQEAGMEESPQQRAMGSIGGLVGDIASGGAAYKGLSGQLLGPQSSLFKRMLAGGAAGGAVVPREDRALAASIGGALPVASGLRLSKIGERAAGVLKGKEQEYGALYKKLFSEAEKAGADIVKVPGPLKSMTTDAKHVLQHAGRKYNASIKRFIDNPTLERAHTAQSDLGKMVRNIEKKIKTGKEVSGGEREALSLAKNMRKRVKGSMQQSFVDSGRSDLADKYGELTGAFRENVVPFSKPEVRKLKEGLEKAYPKKAARQLMETDKYTPLNPLLKKQIPGLGVRKRVADLSSPAKTFIGGAAGMTAGSALLPMLSGAGVPLPSYLRQLLYKGY